MNQVQIIMGMVDLNARRLTVYTSHYSLHNVDLIMLHFWLQQASNNFDDSGFFSIQVIDKALQVWGLNLVQYNSQDAIARAARQTPM